MNEYVQQQYRQAEETLLLARASRMDRLLQSDFRQTSLSWILVQFWLCTLISAALFGFAGLLVYSLTDMTFWFSTPRLLPVIFYINSLAQQLPPNLASQDQVVGLLAAGAGLFGLWTSYICVRIAARFKDATAIARQKSALNREIRILDRNLKNLGALADDYSRKLERRVPIDLTEGMCEPIDIATAITKSPVRLDSVPTTPWPISTARFLGALVLSFFFAAKLANGFYLLPSDWDRFANVILLICVPVLGSYASRLLRPGVFKALLPLLSILIDAVFIVLCCLVLASTEQSTAETYASMEAVATTSTRFFNPTMVILSLLVGVVIVYLVLVAIVRRISNRAAEKRIRRDFERVKELDQLCVQLEKSISLTSMYGR